MYVVHYQYEEKEAAESLVGDITEDLSIDNTVSVCSSSPVMKGGLHSLVCSAVTVKSFTAAVCL